MYKPHTLDTRVWAVWFGVQNEKTTDLFLV